MASTTDPITKPYCCPDHPDAQVRRVLCIQCPRTYQCQCAICGMKLADDVPPRPPIVNAT